MAVRPGTRLGAYEILTLLGSGGMGEVYRARDTKLGRDVAVKVLPELFAADADRVARFRREAQLLASLNHPHIGAIYGLEESNGTTALILELIEGPTLADRLANGAVSLDEGLLIARQIAEALEAAHEKGVIHRDLKPANIKITPAGVVKVLDFGLAKISRVSGDEPEVSQAATRTAAGTRVGVILGTASYMSPEQSRGLTVDKRTDVWAFGCVLYELLTGRRAFEGATPSDTLAAVLGREPEWARLPAATPPSIRRSLQRCLHKDPGQRFRDSGDLRILIDDALSAPPEEQLPIGTASSRSTWPWKVGAFVVLLALGALATYLWTRPSAPVETFRVSISAPGPVTPQLSGAISPDGRSLAFVATGPSGKSMLWVRPLEALEARELPGTERAAHPFWSPDGRSLGFLSDAKVKRVALAGGAVQTLADAPAPFRTGASWSRDGVILFSPWPDRLAMVPAAGGPATTVITADRTKQQTALRWPDFLPDARHFLYFAQSEMPEFRGVYVGSLDSKETRLVLNTDIRAKYGPPGYLLSLRDEALMAQPFDTRSLELHGEPSVIADGIWFVRTANHASFSASQTGVLTYVNASLWNNQLSWFDRSGRPLGPVGPPDRYAVRTPQLSPDGRRIAVGRGEFDRGDIWILDASSGTPSRVTFGPEGDGVPVWAANGRQIMFQTGPRVIVKNLDLGTEEIVFESASDSVADWSHDGRYIVLSRHGSDLWAVALVGDRRPFPFLETPANETQAQLSPDGKWIAYTSNESGRDEVYVQSFPVPGGKRQVSTDGGVMPRWRRDGKELFYLAANQFMMAVSIGNAISLELRTPVPLFRTRVLVQGSESTGLATDYDVTADGQRFLLIGPPQDPGPPMTVVLNWTAALKK
jgi:eukaryotic-like serine/threonine-protein kinase